MRKSIDEIDTLNSLLDSKKKIKTQKHNYYGIILGLVSAFFLSVSNTLIKKTSLLNGSQQACVRYGLQLIIMFIIIKYRKLDMFGEKDKRKLLIMRGLFGMTALICLHFSVKLIDPSDSVALLHTNVILVAILSRLILKEKFSLCFIGALIMSLIGVLFISQPKFLIGNNDFHNTTASFNNQNTTEAFIDSNNNNNKIFTKRMLGILIGLSASIASSLVTIMLKKLTDHKVHHSVAIIYASYFGLPASFLLSLILYFTGIDNKPYFNNYDSFSIILQVLYSLGSATSGVLSQVLMNKALKYEEASKVSITRANDLFFTFILQYFLLDIVSNVFSIIGAILIFFAAVSMIIAKYLNLKYKNCLILKPLI